MLPAGDWQLSSQQEFQHLTLLRKNRTTEKLSTYSSGQLQLLPGSGRTSLLGSCLSAYNLRYSGLLGLCVLSPRPRASARRSCMPPLDLCRETQQQSKYFFASSFPKHPKSSKENQKKVPNFLNNPGVFRNVLKVGTKISKILLKFLVHALSKNFEQPLSPLQEYCY